MDRAVRYGAMRLQQIDWNRVTKVTADWWRTKFEPKWHTNLKETET